MIVFFSKNPTIKRIFIPILPDVTLALLVVADWLIIVAFVQMLLTEWWYSVTVLHSVPEWWNVSILAVLVFIASLIRLWWSKQPALLTPTKVVGSLIVAAGLFVVVVFGYVQYTQYYRWLQTVPKVASVSKSWAIPGDRIAIEGRNFGPAWQQGRVTVGDIELMIVSWTDRRVVAEMVMSERYPTDELIIHTHRGTWNVAVEGFQTGDQLEDLLEGGR